MSKVYDMTIAEFNLRAFAYRRKEQFEWAKFRKVAFSALISFNSDPKRLPKSEKKFLPLPLVDGDIKQVSSETVELFKKAVQQYAQNKKSK